MVFENVLFMITLAGIVIILVVFVYFVFAKLDNRKNDKKFEHVLQTLTKVSDGQQQLVGGLRNISEIQSATQVDMVKQVESRLTEVQQLVSENLLGSATKTAHTLGELQQRLTTIDEAQNNIEKLSRLDKDC